MGIASRRDRWKGHIAPMGKTNATVYLEEPEEERSLSRRTWEIILKFIAEK
jgi:hypothetical protein